MTTRMLGPVTFWWFPDEESPLIDLLARAGITHAFVGDRARARAELVPRELREAVATDPEKLLIGPPTLLDDVSITTATRASGSRNASLTPSKTNGSTWLTDR